MPKFTPISVHDLGQYLREQRQAAQLSLRQLSEVAGISNPYISQIERGLKKPSAEILQSLAKALRISAESLYVRAGILDEHTGLGEAQVMDVTDAILADPQLNDRQRAVLLDVYESFVGEPPTGRASQAHQPSQPADRARPGAATAPTATTQPGPARKRPARKAAPAQKSRASSTSRPGQPTAEQKHTQQSPTKESKS